MPSALAISADDRFVYARGAGAEEGLLAFTRETSTGALIPAGCLRGYRDACTYPGGSADDINALEVTPDDRFVVSAGDEGIGVVNRDPATGALSQRPGNCVVRSDDHTSYDEPSKGCRVDRKIGMPLELDLSPDGATAYVAAEEGGLSAYAIDRATGAPALADREPGGFYEVAVSPDGRNVYAVTEEFDVHAFARDTATGALERIRGKSGCISYRRGCTWLKGVSSPEDIRIAPDGRHLYALESASNGTHGVGVVQLLRRN